MQPARTDRTLSRRRLVAIAALAGSLAIVLLLATHNVSTVPTADDRISGNAILDKAGYGAQWRSSIDTSTFAGQVSTILAVQDAVIKASPNAVQIPFNAPREPANLLQRGMGECSERSRVIEKILNTLGLETRHASIYSVTETGSRLLSLLTPKVGSHAVTEVRTSKGWMVIDSTNRWIGLTSNNDTISLASLQTIDRSKTRWHNLVSGKPHGIFSEQFTYVLGLYSRHGRFYAPYTPIPDVNWSDLLSGLVS